MVQNHAEDLARLRRVLPERAIALAMQSRWSEAADINRKIIELYPNDSDAYNRLGKALMEMGRYRDALATYRRAIELDPNNMIAKKNVERLVHLADREPIESTAGPVQIDGAVPERDGERLNPAIFIEETGKTGLTQLINLGEPEAVLKLAAGDRVDLRAEGQALRVYDEEGRHVGSVEPRLAKRLIGLMEGGNRYTAAVTTVAGGAVTIIIRETYQDPSQRGRLSFPPKALPTGAYRPYMREGALRYSMEEDEDTMFDFESDDVDTDEAEDGDEEADFEEESGDDDDEEEDL
jgi:tetratricopeptide (TPR) repeat protein